MEFECVIVKRQMLNVKLYFSRLTFDVNRLRVFSISSSTAQINKEAGVK